MLPLALALGAALCARDPGDLLRGAVSAAVPRGGVRVEVLGVEGAPAGCALSEADIPRPVLASGRFAAHVRGLDRAGGACDGWAWVRVRLYAPALVTSRAVREGEPLASAVQAVEREILPGDTGLVPLPEDARAARDLRAGTRIEEGALRVGPRPGEAVVVAIRSGALRVEEEGRAAACRPGRACATLPSGRRVDGIWHEGRIVVDLP